MAEIPKIVKSAARREKENAGNGDSAEGAPANKFSKTEDGNKKAKKVVKCRLCMELGHITKNCPLKRKNRATQDGNPSNKQGKNGKKSSKEYRPAFLISYNEMGCFMCGEMGHSGRFCPKFYGKEEDTTNTDTSDNVDKEEDITNTDTSDNVDKEEDITNTDTSDNVDKEEDTTNTDTSDNVDKEEDQKDNEEN